MTRVALAASTLVILMLPRLTGAAHASDDLDGIVVDVKPAFVGLDLGETTTIDVIITNVGATAVAGAVVHVDITDLSGGGSVDPEDWSPTLSVALDTIDIGEVLSVPWELQPISPGRFTAYAVALSADSTIVAASPTLTIDVADRRSLNPEGIVPVAIATPVLVGGLLGVQIRRGRPRVRDRAATSAQQ